MPVTVRVQALLQIWFNGKSEVETEGNTIGECLSRLEDRFPGLQKRLNTAAVFLNGEAIQTMNGLSTRVKDGDEIRILPRMAGG
jgi:molybdopterin converting factor small subunit